MNKLAGYHGTCPEGQYLTGRGRRIDVNLRPDRSMKRVLGQSGLYSETMSQKQTKIQQQKRMNNLIGCKKWVVFIYSSQKFPRCTCVFALGEAACLFLASQTQIQKLY